MRFYLHLIYSEGIKTCTAAYHQGAVLRFWEDPFWGRGYGCRVGSLSGGAPDTGLLILTFICVQTLFCIRTMSLCFYNKPPCDDDFISFSRLLIQGSRADICSLASQQCLLLSCSHLNWYFICDILVITTLGNTCQRPQFTFVCLRQGVLRAWKRSKLIWSGHNFSVQAIKQRETVISDNNILSCEALPPGGATRIGFDTQARDTIM